MGVDHRRRDIGVPEQLLHRTDLRGIAIAAEEDEAADPGFVGLLGPNRRPAPADLRDQPLEKCRGRVLCAHLVQGRRWLALLLAPRPGDTSGGRVGTRRDLKGDGRVLGLERLSRMAPLT